jgi:hypothetical protein
VTAGEDRPVPRGVGIHVPAASAAELGPPARALPVRSVLGLARIEAAMLVRNVLVLAGLLVSGGMVWYITRPVEPLWWYVAWQIGYGQVILAMTVLIATQLATGRDRRDDLKDLYESFPASAGTRTLAHLVSLVGALPASLLLIGGTIALLEHGAIGTPSVAVLGGGLLLVIMAGAAGVAIGARLAHPLAGVVCAILLFVLFSQSDRFAGAVPWLLPWTVPDQLNLLPGPVAGYPPAGAHAVELAAVAVLAGVVALAMIVSRGSRRIALATTGTAAVAVACIAGAAQLQPIPAADLNHLVAEVADPASVQHCSTASQIRYCLYPGFGPLLPVLEPVVNGVLAQLPDRPARSLTIAQAATLSLDDPGLTHGQPERQLARWNTELQAAPDNAAATSAIYLDVGSWPAGGPLATARFDLALSVAEWTVNLSPTSGAASTTAAVHCVPLDQAREAIAIWLAMRASHVPAGELQTGWHTVTEVQNTTVTSWNYPGEFASYLASTGPQTTAAGYLLARAMTSLPAHAVAKVLNASWPTWLDWHTTDAQLAAALGIRMPGVPAPPQLNSGSGPGTRAPSPAPSPLCT